MRADRRVLILGACLIAASALIACEDPEPPDLIPERLVDNPSPSGFCQRDDQGHLQVRVRNQANPDVLDETTTTVEFSPGGPVSHPTAAMPGGSFVDAGPFEIPSACFNPDCSFTIKVDAGGGVTETDETNNEAEGLCVG